MAKVESPMLNCKKYGGCRIASIVSLLFSFVCLTNAEEKISIQDKLLTYLNTGEGKSLIVNYNLFCPAIFTNGNAIYESTEERDKCYYNLNIWKKDKLNEYQIKEISYVANELSLKPVAIELKALLPEKFEDSLPDGSLVLLKGKTTEGKEIPLIFIVPKGKNRIINISFSTRFNFELRKEIMLNILGYIKKLNNIKPEIDVKAYMGSIENLYDPGPEVQADKLFHASFLNNGKPAFAGKYLGDEPIIGMHFKFNQKSYQTELLNPDGICTYSPDGSIFSATYFSGIEGRVQVSCDRATPWLLETLDGYDYTHTNIFHLFIKPATADAKFFFMRPVFWVGEEQIFAFKIEKDELINVPIKIDKTVLIVENAKGDYLIYYGAPIKEKRLLEFWKKFYVQVKNKKEIPDEEIPDYSKYPDDFNIIWIGL